MVIPEDHTLRIVQTGCHLYNGRRLEGVPKEFFRPSPYHLHRLTRQLGQPGRVHGLSVPLLSAKSAPNKRSDDAHVLQRQAQSVGDFLLRWEGYLGRSPDRRFTALYVGDSGMGLDGSMSHVPLSIGGFNHLGCVLSSLPEIAAFSHWFPG